MMFAKVINECNCAKSILRSIIANNNNNTDECTILRKQMHACCKDATVSEFKKYIEHYIDRYSKYNERLRCMIRDFKSIDEIINCFNQKLEYANGCEYQEEIIIYTMISSAIMYGNIEVFKFMVINGYLKNMWLYDTSLGMCSNSEIFKIIDDYKIRKRIKIRDIMYLFCNPLLVDIDKTFSIAVDLKWLELFLSYFDTNIIMFPNIICYAIQNDILKTKYKYIDFVYNVVFESRKIIGLHNNDKFYDKCKKQIIDVIVNDSNMNESKIKRLCKVFINNIETYSLRDKQLYPLVTLFKFIGNKIAESQWKTIQKLLYFKFKYDDLFTYDKLRILIVLSNNYSILHKMIEMNNENKIIELSYSCSINTPDYDVYYVNTKYSFKELNIKYLEYIKNHYI